MKAALIAGDGRQKYVGGSLEKWGFRVEYYRVPGIAPDDRSLREVLFGADVAVLPCPMGKGRTICAGTEEILLENIISCLQQGCCLVGGMPDAEAALLASGMGMPIYDVLGYEPLQQRNALPTAEGALALAIENTPGTIMGAHALITGFGRCGRSLASLLLAVGARVTVAARRRDALALAESMGCSALHVSRMAEILPQVDIVFNTVPSRIFGEGELSLLGSEVPYLELASSPGGADREMAAGIGVRYVAAGGLPGKTAPKAAGKYIADAIIDILSERGQWYGDQRT